MENTETLSKFIDPIKKIANKMWHYKSSGAQEKIIGSVFVAWVK